jgi:uncharacterized membrane protein YeaQ/YmgE (transglycosylase-associated protein family)
MSMFALVSLEPGGVIAWLLVGLIAGFLASRVMGAGGYGVVGDIVVGLIGAFLGGLLFGMFAVGDYGVVGSIAVAFVGACVLIWIVRTVAPRRGSL